jgi:hypothetical protein
MTKDELEWAYLNGFAEAFADFPTGKIEKSENPDFLLRGGSHTLGIELTRLFHPPEQSGFLLREQESLRQSVVTNAKRLYDVYGLPAVNVGVFFNDHHPLRKVDVRAVSRSVFDIVVRLNPKTGESREEEYDWVNRAYFPEQIAAVRVARLEGLNESEFGAPTGALLPTVSHTDLQTEIDGKESRLSDYRRVCDKAWLVMCLNGESLSSTLTIPDDTVGAAYRSAFDRVFVFNWPTTIYTLKVRLG